MDDEMPPDPSPGLLLCDRVTLEGTTGEGFPFVHVFSPCIVNISQPQPDEPPKTPNTQDSVNPPEDPS